MGKQVYELNKKQEKLFLAISENSSEIEKKLNELRQLKATNESLLKEQNETNLQIKSNEDFIKDEISKLNQQYEDVGLLFESNNPDNVNISMKMDMDFYLIDSYVYNKENESWEYNNGLPFAQLTTKQRVQYFKNIENIFNTISKF